MPHIAKDIIEEVNSITDYSIIPTLDEKEGIKNGLIQVLDKEIDSAFMEEVKKKSLRKDIINKVGKEFKIVYTPLSGTGNIPIRRVLKEIGFENVIVVEEQAIPDPNFAGLQYPNPEEKIALNKGIELAKSENADIVIATDPDCDRVGVAVRNNSGEYVLLTGTQIGALLANYILENLSIKNELPKNGTIIKTIVTSELGYKIARHYDVDCLNVLTGFKFIGDKIKEFEVTNEYSFIMGYEESYGYLVGTHARDKDGVVASMLISEMAAYYNSKNMSLYEGLIELYNKFGYYKEDMISVTLKGIEGMEKIKEIIKYFRENKLENIGGLNVKEVKDYSLGIDNLPKSDVIKYILEDDSWVAIRPSGTEPKLKFYLAVSDNAEDSSSNKLSILKNDIKSILDKLN